MWGWMNLSLYKDLFYQESFTSAWTAQERWWTNRSIKGALTVCMIIKLSNIALPPAFFPQKLLQLFHLMAICELSPQLLWSNSMSSFCRVWKLAFHLQWQASDWTTLKGDKNSIRYTFLGKMIKDFLFIWYILGSCYLRKCIIYLLLF